MPNAVSQLTPEQVKLLSDFFDLLKIVIPSVITLLAALLSVRIAHRYDMRRFEREKHLDFLRQQLNEFYSPMLGRIRRIRASSELRVELSSGGNAAWEKICKKGGKPFVDHDKYFEPFKRQSEKEDERFPRFLLPLYQEMVNVFTKGFWLAEEDTQEFYKPFCRYVELWERYYEESIPPGVLEEVPIEEAPLTPFYENLEVHMKGLRQELSEGGNRRTSVNNSD